MPQQPHPPPPPAPTKALPKQALATRVHPAARPSKSKHKSNHKRRHKSKPWSCCAQGSRQSYSKSCTFSPAMAQSTKIRAASSSRCTTSLALSSRCLRNCTPAGAATSRWPTTAQANLILYDLFFKQLGSGTVYGIETRPELVEKSTALAQQLGFARMQFLALSVQQASASSALPDSFDVVTALHACDTATDDAIAFALQKNAQHLVLVPCCQAEAAACLRQHKAEQLARTPLAELWRHPLHTREIGSQLTNVMRCLYLEALGYRVTVTELVGWEHSMKNELILASYTGQKKRSAATRMHSIAESFGLQDWLQTRFPWVMQINQTFD